MKTVITGKRMKQCCRFLEDIVVEFLTAKSLEWAIYGRI
jgi:hypothetical protein